MDFNKVRWVHRPNLFSCKPKIKGDQLEEVREFKYLVVCCVKLISWRVRQRKELYRTGKQSVNWKI